MQWRAVVIVEDGAMAAGQGELRHRGRCLGFLCGQRHAPRGSKPFGNVRRHGIRRGIECRADLAGEAAFLYISLVSAHSRTPRARKACASVCVAREQCVLTLPSEQPIAAAVSATSISSQ
ncbi:hypothetical protein D3C81_1283590 [compost metagenome]